MFVVRLWGFHYDETGEVCTLGWMTKNGGCSTNRRYAQRYESEAEAWEHAAATENVGSDEDGDWCFVAPEEPVPDRSAALRVFQEGQRVVTPLGPGSVTRYRPETFSKGMVHDPIVSVKLDLDVRPPRTFKVEEVRDEHHS